MYFRVCALKKLFGALLYEFLRFLLDLWCLVIPSGVAQHGNVTVIAHVLKVSVCGASWSFDSTWGPRLIAPEWVFIWFNLHAVFSLFFVHHIFFPTTKLSIKIFEYSTLRANFFHNNLKIWNSATSHNITLISVLKSLFFSFFASGNKYLKYWLMNLKF